MALIGNRSILNRNLSRAFAGSAAYSLTAVNAATWKYGAFAKEAAVPWGTLQPTAWVLPRSPGGMRVTGGATGSGSAFGYAARVMVGTGSGLGNGSASASAVSSGVATGAGLGNGTAVAAAIASGVATGSALGNGVAFMGGIINIIVAGSATGSGQATMTALANIVATGGGIPDATLTPAQIASAVWDAVAASYDTAGTMGEKVVNSEKNSKLIPAGV